MLQILSQKMKPHWKRALSMLLAALTVIGMLPATAFAAETASKYPSTGSFEGNIAGSTGWNGMSQPLSVYDSENGSTETVSVSASIPFVILEDQGGDRVKIGLVSDERGSVIPWTGGAVDKTGWVDKGAILVNLPDVLPSIAYKEDTAGARHFNLRLDRREVTVPCPYVTAQQLAKTQKSAMANGETLVIRQTESAMSLDLAAGDPEELYEYSLDGTAYRKYETFSVLSDTARLEKYCAGTGLISITNALENVRGNYASGSIPSISPSKALAQFASRPARAKASPRSGPTGGTGGLNPGSPGGQQPTRKDVAWTTDPERTFLRFTLIEFPEGVVTDLNTNDRGIWKVKGTPLNVVWGDGSIENWDADACRRNIVWFNSNAMQYNGMGANAAQMMGGTVYAYDATAGYNQRWVTTADEFQKETGITDQQKEAMFHCRSSNWSTAWVNGDYTSMWGTDPQPVTSGNQYMVYVRSVP